MDDDFTGAVEEGLKLSKRIYTGKPPPRPADHFMERSAPVLIPTAPTAYAVIADPSIVDNPDFPSYQPHVYGRLDPPALIPLQMREVGMEAECCLDRAVVTVRGRWRVHCVMGSKCCDCRFVIPMGEEGSILGVEVDVNGRSYSTRVIRTEDENSLKNVPEKEDGGFLKAQYFSCTVPLVYGGSEINLKVCWLQKLSYEDGQFSIVVPFNFPEYVTPFSKLFSKREKIQLHVDSGTGKEVLCQNTSHPLKEKGRQVGKLSFLYEAEVDSWSRKDFYFSYSVYSSDLFGGVLVQSPSKDDFDQREMFCLYVFPGSNQKRKVFRKEVVYVVDISGSMRGKPLENVKNALSTAVRELTPRDYFGIIAFNEDMHLFSSSLETANLDMVESAIHWINKTFVDEGGSNITQVLIAQPLNKAISLLTKSQDSVQHIFLITDGSVEDERSVCNTMNIHVSNCGAMSPRISTFGIGTFCNHYFLQTLASIGRGKYSAAYNPNSIEVEMQKWLRTVSSPIVANITADIFYELDAFEMYPSHIPDLSVECPLIVVGRYQGGFPDSLKVKGSLADLKEVVVNLKVQKTEIPLERIFAKQQLDLLTAQAWFSESKQLLEKVIKTSEQCGIPSEYTCLVLRQTQPDIQDMVKEKSKKAKLQKLEAARDRYLSRGMKLGFGNIVATTDNLPTGFFSDPKPPEPLLVYKAVGCCSQLCDCCCCMHCIGICSKLNDQFVIVMTQLCTALSCLACFECCSTLCCDGSD